MLYFINQVSDVYFWIQYKLLSTREFPMVQSSPWVGRSTKLIFKPMDLLDTYGTSAASESCHYIIRLNSADVGYQSVKGSIWVEGGSIEYSEMHEAAPYWL
jgi:hypothetical protein